jgi:hypothetical protein
MITYRRKCKSSPCFWEDDIDRKMEDNPIDYREKTIYECPECGNNDVEITVKVDNNIVQIWSTVGYAQFDARFWDLGVIDKYTGDRYDNQNKT